MRPLIGAPDARLETGGGACSLWWRESPRPGAGVIGEIEASDARSAAELLERACEALAGQGCTAALGPMDGSTWRSYRAITETALEPRFLLEPNGPPGLADAFRAAGFEVVASYASSLQDRIDADPRCGDRLEARVRREGYRVRCIDPASFRAELRRLHPLCMQAFRGAFLFTPIDPEAFVECLAPLAVHLSPGLALVAERDEVPAAFVLALPDRLDGANRTVIVKTVATLPGRQYAGLAHLLAARAGEQSRRMGFARAIHALMRDRGPSMAWSAKRGRVIRRYALFIRPVKG